MEAGDVLGVEPHGDLDRCKLATLIWDDQDLFDFADGDTLQVDGGTILKAGGVLEVAGHGNFVGKHAKTSRTIEIRTITPTLSCDHWTSV